MQNFKHSYELYITIVLLLWQQNSLTASFFATLHSKWTTLYKITRFEKSLWDGFRKQRNFGETDASPFLSLFDWRKTIEQRFQKLVDDPVHKLCSFLHNWSMSAVPAVFILIATFNGSFNFTVAAIWNTMFTFSINIISSEEGSQSGRLTSSSTGWTLLKNRGIFRCCHKSEDKRRE